LRWSFTGATDEVVVVDCGKRLSSGKSAVEASCWAEAEAEAEGVEEVEVVIVSSKSIVSVWQMARGKVVRCSGDGIKEFRRLGRVFNVRDCLAKVLRARMLKRKGR
jgi:hypothetical protein